MYYGAEVRQVAEFEVLTEAVVTPQEVTLATKLLGSLEGPFEPENYEDGHQSVKCWYLSAIEIGL